MSGVKKTPVSAPLAHQNAADGEYKNNAAPAEAATMQLARVCLSPLGISSDNVLKVAALNHEIAKP